MNRPLYVCYSLPLKKYLRDNGVKYEVNGKHIETDKPFWVYIRDDKLDMLLNKWSLGER